MLHPMFHTLRTKEPCAGGRIEEFIMSYSIGAVI